MKRLVAATVSLLLLAACGGAGASPGTSPGTPKTGGTLRVAQAEELRTLDPVKSSQLVERAVYYQMYESLLAIDSRLNIQPLLATKWETPDPTTYVFTLRTGVKFHDGTDLTAESVKFNIDRVLLAATSPRKAELASVKSVEAKDSTTVIFHLKNPDAALLSQLVDRSGMILSPAAVQKAGADLGLKPLGAGTGPFQFVEWKRDDHLTLKKNPNYWKRGLPYLDEIIYRAIPNADAIAAGLKTGDIDVAHQVSAKDIGAIKSNPDLIYKDIPGLSWWGVRLNRGAGPFADLAKAKAVALAIDRAQILKTVYFNVGNVSYGPIAPSSWAFDPSEKIYDKADPAKAKATASGFTFSFLTQNRPDRIQEAELIKDQLTKVGITANIRILEFGQLLNELDAHNFDAAILGWSGRIDPDGNIYQHFHTGAGNNYGRYSNPQVDKLLEDGRIASEQSKRKQLYQEAQRILVSEVANVFTRHEPAQQVTNKKVHNYQLFPDDMFRFAEVWKG
jgi:peptide/nickel transport system substrate-binding protein